MVFNNKAELLPALTKGLVFLMAAASGFTVANVYLNQTLLVSMANTFHVSETSIGIVATLTQVGYAFGNLLLVPLGDIFEQRKLILILLSTVCVILAAAALSMNVTWLIAANFILGFVTIVPQIIVPLAANLVPEGSRGKVLGSVAIGLVSGILGARFIGGFVDSHFGWRSMYWVSFSSTIIIIILIAMYLPKSTGKHVLQYKKLLASLGPLFIRENALQRACLSQGMIFASFSAFWTTLVFLLSTSPYSFGSAMVGLIGLVGIAGAFATPIIGRVIDKKGPEFANALCMFISLIAFLILIFLGYRLPGLILGALLVTVGTQANQVACQAAIFQLSPEKRNRLNGLYMVCTFLGGALGSYLGVLAWSKWHWYGVCIVGMLMIGIAFSSLISLPKQDSKKV
ncbi:MFS transporter [Paenibacillus sp. MDMC362]|uniref:MFS transporter n=1 Tax=Paenibacillus sp. MDMC362 TaxID=2977365 RepID=UPI000DC322F4|nr:MFS transporter [Paenibacillus sp. MDMC362]RAR38966.1 MFS transporter [Paenibacillus sp. MDMC362]